MSDKNDTPKGTIGGHARAAKLTKEERSASASKAAAARWGIPKATHEGTIKIGSKEVPCAVLEDGTRLLSQAGFLRALGRNPRPNSSRDFDDSARIVSASNLKSFISTELEASMKPVEYIVARGGKALGFNADLLPQVCEVYLEARENGALHYTQLSTAKAAEIVMRGLARVGITALIDEATGYQEVRAKHALAEILEKFIAKELQAWTKTFPVEFYEQIFRLNGWNFDPKSVKRPVVIGRWTNDIVYDRLAPGVLDELKSKNPVVNGRRKHKHFQWLTGEIGHPKLLAHIEGVKILMRISKSWDQFKGMLDQHYPKIATTELGMEVEVKSKGFRAFKRLPSSSETSA